MVRWHTESVSCIFSTGHRNGMHFMKNMLAIQRLIVWVWTLVGASTSSVVMKESPEFFELQQANLEEMTIVNCSLGEHKPL